MQIKQYISLPLYEIFMPTLLWFKSECSQGEKIAGNLCLSDGAVLLLAPRVLPSPRVRGEGARGASEGRGRGQLPGVPAPDHPCDNRQLGSVAQLDRAVPS